MQPSADLMPVGRLVRDPAPVHTLAAVPSLGTILGVWAHPDDETYLAAGLVAAAAAAGQKVVCVTATRGEHGTDDPISLPPWRLARIREAELAAALNVLGGRHGVIAHRYLGDGPTARAGYVDGALDTVPLPRAVADVADVITDVRPDTVLTFGPDGMTGHLDHRAVCAWTTAAFEVAAPAGARLLYAAKPPAWTAEFEDDIPMMPEAADAPDVPVTHDLAVRLRLDGAMLDRKLDALAAQPSQTTVLRGSLGPQRYRAFVAEEHFTLAARQPPDS